MLWVAAAGTGTGPLVALMPRDVGVCARAYRLGAPMTGVGSGSEAMMMLFMLFRLSRLTCFKGT